MEPVDEPACLSSKHLLGVARFGGAAAGETPPWPEARIALPIWRGPLTDEAWVSPEPVAYGRIGQVDFGHNSQVLFGCIAQPESARELPEQITLRAYRELLQASRQLGFPHLLRVWNHFPDINGDSLGSERYQRFSMGRYQALEEFGYRFDGDLPAASAVGTPAGSGGLDIYFLAARRPGLAIENPRQVSAYRYPKRYGPRSPSFSRATLADFGAEQQLYISGTASIAGHVSLHAGDLEAQLAETLTNIQVILDQPQLRQRRTLESLGEDGAFKVYVRHAEHAEAIRRRLQQTLAPTSPVIYLLGEICRRDLLLEIEAVIRFR